MYRNTLFAALVALGLTGWAATESFAQGSPRPQLRPQEPPQLQLRPQGVVVTDVLPGGSASRQGIEVGDVIASVNGLPVRSSTDLALLLSRSGRVAELGIIDWRTGWTNAVLVYPTAGRIGVDVRPVGSVNPPWDSPVRPIRPIIQPPDRPSIQPVRPIIQPAPRPIIQPAPPIGPATASGR